MSINGSFFFSVKAGRIDKLRVAGDVSLFEEIRASEPDDPEEPDEPDEPEEPEED